MKRFRRSVPAGLCLCWLFLASFVCLACAKKNEVIVETAADKQLSAADIDRDPLALLPGNAIGVFLIDAQKLFKSEFGQKLLAIARARTPLPPSAGFEPARDLSKLYIGSYSMQGVDVAAVITGNFDQAKIEKAASSTEQTPLGTPIVKSSYAGRTLYTSQNIGFSVLTSHTVLAGNETGIRRALDRIKEGRVTRQIPAWLDKLAQTPNAAVIGGADLRAQPISEAVTKELVFLNGVQTVRGVGNFEPPGMNLAGSLSYSDEQAALAGADGLQKLQQTLQNYGWIMAIIGIAQPVRTLQAQAQGKEAKFVIGLDGAAIGKLLDKAQDFMAVPPSAEPVPATLSPGTAE